MSTTMPTTMSKLAPAPTSVRLRHVTCRLLLAGSLCCGTLASTQVCEAAGPDLAALVLRAKAAQDAGDTALARTLIDPVLRAPLLDGATRAETYLLRARLFLQEGAPVSARLDATRATHYDPTNGEALSLLARLYRADGGPAADIETSARLYLKAARQGVVEAQREAGALLLDGVGITADLRKARYWLGQAAEAGDVHAMLLLARSYGDAVAPELRNPGRAADWLRRAAALGALGGSAGPADAHRPAHAPVSTLEGGSAGGLDEDRDP
jgi:TPR repeat protein